MSEPVWWMRPVPGAGSTFGIVRVARVEPDVPRDRAVPAAVFHASDTDGLDIWRLAQDETWLLCKSEFKTAVEDGGLSNIAFLEVGEIRR